MDDVIGFEALYESAMKCKKGVLWKDSVAHYILNLVEETVKLEDQLKNGTYRPRPQRPFTVNSCGKMRTVMGVAFRDRVYQRSLNDNAIYPTMVKGFIYDNGACQKNKGTNFSRERLVCFFAEILSQARHARLCFTMRYQGILSEYAPRRCRKNI